MTATRPVFAPDPRIHPRVRPYPRVGLYSLPPDPKRKSLNLMILCRKGPRGPLEIVCCNPCLEKGRSRPDGSCRHTDIVMSELKPWWRSRARPVQATAPESRPAERAGAGS